MLSKSDDEIVQQIRKASNAANHEIKEAVYNSSDEYISSAYQIIKVNRLLKADSPS